MSELNPVLMTLAERRVWRDAGVEKRAFQPPMDPAAGGMPPGGAPPMDPAMGGAPPMDPSMGGAPPMDPMAGGMPPGAPPMDPMAGGMGGAPPMDPAMGGAPPPKMKPEQMMMMLDYRMYNMQQQMTAILSGLNITVPPGALVMPPGAAQAPPAEAALPGGPQDPTQQAGAEPGGAGAGGPSAIGAIDPIQGASPELAAGKMASAMHTPAAEEFLRDANANAPAGYHVALVKQADPVAPLLDTAPHIGEPVATDMTNVPTGASALGALYRARTQGQ